VEIYLWGNIINVQYWLGWTMPV